MSPQKQVLLALKIQQSVNSKNHLGILSVNKNMERIEFPSFAIEFVSFEGRIKEVDKLNIKKRLRHWMYLLK